MLTSENSKSAAHASTCAIGGARHTKRLIPTIANLTVLVSVSAKELIECPERHAIPDAGQPRSRYMYLRVLLREGHQWPRLIELQEFRIPMYQLDRSDVNLPEIDVDGLNFRSPLIASLDS
jgi:hypothetical protein